MHIVVVQVVAHLLGWSVNGEIFAINLKVAADIPSADVHTDKISVATLWRWL
jgi:hypothetical protein